MDIKFERGLRKENATLLCEWSNERGEAFQEQWMGLKISYPLTYDKIREMENVFSIFDEDEFLGMIQQIRIEKDNISQKARNGFWKRGNKSFYRFDF